MKQPFRGCNHLAGKPTEGTVISVASNPTCPPLLETYKVGKHTKSAVKKGNNSAMTAQKCLTALSAGLPTFLVNRR